MSAGLPVLIVAATVSTYWLCVFGMVGRSWIRFRGPAGAVPKTRTERRMWLLWLPNTAAWIALPWLAWDGGRQTLVSPTTPWELSGLAINSLAALLAVLAFALTVRCWLAMGSNWTMAVNPKKPTQLLTQGPFALVRHPIYALSQLLMVSTVVVVATWPMLLVGAIHIALLMAKAASEERYLRNLHGEAYAQYCRITNRFLPWRLSWVPRWQAS